MRWLVTGSSGQLGRDIVKALCRRSTHDVILTPSRSEMDLGDFGSIERHISSFRPDVLVNCGAWTRVDDAEQDAAYVMRINGEAPLVMANSMAQARKGLLVQISTDYVFDGLRDSPYPEDAPTTPLSVYGASKATGERVLEVLPSNTLVIRTAWLYSQRQNNMLRYILDGLENDTSLGIVSDQVGHPSWTWDVAERVIALSCGVFAKSVEPGRVVHAVNAGSTTWFHFAQEVARLTGRETTLIFPISSAELDRRARRPRSTRLSDSRALASGLTDMPCWREALARCLKSSGASASLRSSLSERQH